MSTNENVKYIKHIGMKFWRTLRLKCFGLPAWPSSDIERKRFRSALLNICGRFKMILWVKTIRTKRQRKEKHTDQCLTGWSVSVSVDIQFLSFPPASFSHFISTVPNNCITTSSTCKYNVIMVFKSVYNNILDKLGHYFSLKSRCN